MDAATKFDMMLRAMVGEEEMTEMKIEAAMSHPRFCSCEVCTHQRRLLFVDLTKRGWLEQGMGML